MSKSDNLYQDLKDKAAFFVSKKNLHAVMKSDKIEDVLRSVSNYSGRGFYDKIRLAQIDEELYELCLRVVKHKPKVIAEIGTWNGGTFYVWTRINPQAKKIISIDLPDGQFGGGYDSKRIKFFKEFAYDRDASQLYFIRGDSKAKTTTDELEKILNGDKIDFLYIDGDHTYEGIKKDFEIYLNFLSNDGLIGFHDINTHKDGYGVVKFWNETKVKYRYEEFIKKDSKVMGNGLIYLGK
ncbi:MAG: class I SAM-dependent methyltransferase [Ignavibacteria bacterium]